ncbi:MAG: lipopolysaccharide biosynthesis protein [Intrasporangium sp.]|uniref:lipopolysaccharide biosynthesis protein n=1 Tax=Intrasporangium sp. TaxID=1925024 RepID=UPI003F812509
MPDGPRLLGRFPDGTDSVTASEQPPTAAQQSSARWRVDLTASTDGSMASRGVLSTLGLLFQGGLRFATSWLVGRLAGQAVLGSVQAAISTGTLLALLWPTTSGSAASKYLARARGAGDLEELHAVATHLRRRTLLAAAAVAVLAVPAWLLLDDGLLRDAVWVAVFAAAYSGYSFTRGVFFGVGQVRRATTWDGIGAALGLVGLAVALLLGVRGTALIAPIAGAYLLYSIAGWPRGPSVVPRRELRRELDHMILLGAAGTIASTGFLQIAMVVAKGAGSPDEAGQFAAAMVTATPASLLASSLGLVLFPALAQAWGRGDRDTFRAQTNQATRVLVLVMLTIFGSLILTSRLVIDLVWGSEFSRSATLFPILIGAVLTTNLAIASVNALITRSHRAMLVTSGASIAGLVVGCVTWLVLVPRSGVLGVAVGFLLGSLVNGLVPLIVEWRVGGHAWAGLALRLGAGIVIIGSGFTLQRLFDLPAATDPLVAGLFCLLWWTLSRRDLSLLPFRGSFSRKRP